LNTAVPPPLPPNYCSQCGAGIQANANFCHACGARIEKSGGSSQAPREQPPASTPDTELTTDQRRALEGKRPLSKSYIARHWRGELSLPRSYWINGVLLNIGFQFATRIIAVIELDVVHSNIALGIALGAILFFWFLIVSPWQLVGLWRSSKYYFGWQVWSGLVQLQVILGWIAYGFFILITVNKFLPK
jgi:hypothetical protein